MTRTQFVLDWIADVKRCLEDVSTEMRARGRGDERFQRLIHRLPGSTAIAALEAGRSSDWVLVPREPTKEMVARGADYIERWMAGIETNESAAAKCVYEEMLATVPWHPGCAVCGEARCEGYPSCNIASLAAPQQPTGRSGEAVHPDWTNWAAEFSKHLVVFGLDKGAADAIAAEEVREFLVGECECGLEHPQDMADLFADAMDANVERWKRESVGRPHGFNPKRAAPQQPPADGLRKQDDPGCKHQAAAYALLADELDESLSHQQPAPSVSEDDGAPR